MSMEDDLAKRGYHPHQIETIKNLMVVGQGGGKTEWLRKNMSAMVANSVIVSKMNTTNDKTVNSTTTSNDEDWIGKLIVDRVDDFYNKLNVSAETVLPMSEDDSEIRKRLVDKVKTSFEYDKFTVSNTKIRFLDDFPIIDEVAVIKGKPVPSYVEGFFNPDCKCPICEAGYPVSNLNQRMVKPSWPTK